MDNDTKNIVGLVVNLFFPGIGTIIWGDTKTGVIQLVLCVVGFFLSFVLIGIPIMIGVWIWALVCGIIKISKKA